MKQAVPAVVLPVLLCAAILAAGCLGQGQGVAGEDLPGQPPAAAQNASSGLGTMNLSFSREAGDVMNTDTKLFEIPRFDFTNATTSDGRLIVNYFHSVHCSACAALRPELDRLEAAYPSVEWREFDITTQNGSWAYQQFADGRNMSSAERMVPQVLVNGTVMTDRFNINRTLPGLLAAFSAARP